jgi:hypothetical protein
MAVIITMSPGDSWFLKMTFRGFLGSRRRVNALNTAGFVPWPRSREFPEGNWGVIFGETLEPVKERPAPRVGLRVELGMAAASAPKKMATASRPWLA